MKQADPESDSPPGNGAGRERSFDSNPSGNKKVRNFITLKMPDQLKPNMTIFEYILRKIIQYKHILNMILGKDASTCRLQALIALR